MGAKVAANMSNLGGRESGSTAAAAAAARRLFANRRNGPKCARTKRGKDSKKRHCTLYGMETVEWARKTSAKKRLQTTDRAARGSHQK